MEFTATAEAAEGYYFKKKKLYIFRTTEFKYLNSRLQ